MRSDAKYKTKNNHKNKNNPIPKAGDGVPVENSEKPGFRWKNLWKTGMIAAFSQRIGGVQTPYCTCLRTRPEETLRASDGFKL